MLTSFIFSEGCYVAPNIYSNDPTLATIEHVFQGKGEELRTINWTVNSATRGCYDISQCMQDVDFSGVREAEKFIVLNGDGFTHGRTYFLAKQLNCEFSYIHIDAHPDFGRASEDADYAGFVGNVENLDNVVKTFLLGISHDSLSKNISYYLHTAPGEKGIPPLLLSTKARVYPVNHSSCLLAAYGLDCKNLDTFTPKKIPTKKVYVSIDLDVIHGFPTLWPHDGQLSFEQVEQIVSKICGSKEIIGADICGFSPFAAQGTVQEPLEKLYDIYTLLKSEMSA